MVLYLAINNEYKSNFYEKDNALVQKPRYAIIASISTRKFIKFDVIIKNFQKK